MVLPLLGTYQYHNAAVVLDTVDALIHRGISIPEHAIYAGLKNVVWPSRFEVLNRHPLFLLDSTHNPNGTEELVNCLRQYLPDKKLIFVVGVLADKDYQNMTAQLAPYAKQFVAVTPKKHRSLGSSVLKKAIQSCVYGAGAGRRRREKRPCLRHGPSRIRGCFVCFWLIVSGGRNPSALCEIPVNPNWHRPGLRLSIK